jgi:DNA-binding NarL/FixJ family response regulator
MKTLSVLIIDDHPVIIEAFTSAFNYVSGEDKALGFLLDSATDCKTAFHKLESYITSKTLDLVILDLSLPAAPELNLFSGDDLGQIIRKDFPNTLILVITTFTDSIRIRQVVKNIDPKGFLNKQDVTFNDIVAAIKSVLSGDMYYSKTIVKAIKQKSLQGIQLDAYDILILKELANGSKMSDLINLLPLSKSAIDKRKRLLKLKLNTGTNSDRDLVLVARSKGFI